LTLPIFHAIIYMGLSNGSKLQIFNKSILASPQCGAQPITERSVMTRYGDERNHRVKDWNAIGILLLPITLFLMTLNIMTRDHLGLRDAWVIGWRMGAFIYLVVFGIFFWRIQKPKVGRVYKNVLASDPEPRTENTAGQPVRPTDIYIGVQGPAFVPPWWQPVGDPIDMTAEIIRQTIEVNDIFGWRYKITYITPMSAAPGRYLPNHQNYTDEEAMTYLNAELQGEVQAIFGQLDGAEVRKDFRAFQARFENLLGGEGTLSGPEKVVGRYTRKLVIESVLPSAEAQKTSELAGRVARLSEATRTLRETGVTDPNRAAVLAAAADGIPVTLVSVTGLENLTHFNTAGLFGGQQGGGGNQGRGGKGRGKKRR
jgi:pimeloyl-ACP methyl ester carboxylesterase